MSDAAETPSRSRPLAIVTGASAGIGVELARLAAADGYRPLLVARRRERLEGVARELDAAHGCGARVAAVDLTDRDGPGRVLEAAGSEPIAMLVNNAGFATFGPFAETEIERTTDLIDLNVTALTRLTHLVLGPMIEADAGYIMNVASTAAFMPGPGMATYYASKAYVLHFTEALAHELRGTGIRVSACCPGPTRTEFHDVADMTDSPLLDRLSWMSAEEVAERGYRGLLAGRPVVVTGGLNKLTTWAPRWLPRRWVTRLVGRIQMTRGR
ncbi:MAG: SDR family oxidoreductase [Gemmatimonadota bacterium]|nr:SDR family oxidoreductase [Gemmatimonadota bacterium]